MLTVGPRSTCAPFNVVSRASACPTRSIRSVSHVEASEISAGKQAYFTYSFTLVLFLCLNKNPFGFQRLYNSITMIHREVIRRSKNPTHTLFLDLLLCFPWSGPPCVLTRSTSESVLSICSTRCIKATTFGRTHPLPRSTTDST